MSIDPISNCLVLHKTFASVLHREAAQRAGSVAAEAGLFDARKAGQGAQEAADAPLHGAPGNGGAVGGPFFRPTRAQAGDGAPGKTESTL